MKNNLGKLWIVSPPRMARFAFDQPGSRISPTVAREYRISPIGQYLISPAPLNVRKQLVGCKIYWHCAPLLRWIHRLIHIKGEKAAGLRPPLSLIMDFPRPVVSLSDSNLEHHIHHLYDNLRPFESFHPTLSEIDPDLVAKVAGICTDEAGYRSPVAIGGDPPQQLEYVRQHAGEEIDVRLKRAHIADGLFEMKGFDFIKYDPQHHHRLIRFIHEGVPKACVVNDDHSIAFWLDDVKLVDYLQLFEYCIQHNDHMRESLNDCIQGKAVALRLMFNHHPEIDYSRAPLPALFQEVIGDTRLADHTNRLIKQNLNLYQIGVSLHCMTLQDGRTEPFTHTSILQNLQALEPIRESLPTLFAEVAKRSAQAEGGSFYLLESICGVHNES